MGLKNIAILFLLFALVFTLFGKTISHGFNSDDYLVVYHGLHGHTAEEHEGLAELLSPSWGLYYRPAIKAFFGLLAKMFHLWPGGYHLISLVCYVILCFEVYLLAQRLTGDWTPAVASALIFMAATTHAEAIFWISSVNGVVENILTLASLIFFITWRKRTLLPRTSGTSCANGKKQVGAQHAAPSRMTAGWIALPYVLSIILFGVALLTKESAVSLPLIVFSYDLLLGSSGDWATCRKDAQAAPAKQEARSVTSRLWQDIGFQDGRVSAAIKRSITSCLPFVILGVLFMAVRHVVMRGAHLPPALTTFEWESLVLGSWYSLIMSLSPIDWALALNLFDRLARTSGFPVVGGIAILALVIAPLVFRKLRATFLLWWILASAAPVLGLGLVPSERHMVLGSVGAAILVSVTLFKLSERLSQQSKAYAAAVGFVLVIAFAGTSFHFLRQRQAIWGRASQIASDIVEQTMRFYPAPAPDTTFFFLNVPDAIEGALVFRFDNLAYALRLFYGDDSMDAARIVTIDSVPYSSLVSGKSAYFKIGAMGGHIYFAGGSPQDPASMERWQKMELLEILASDDRYLEDWGRFSASPFLVFENGALSPRSPEALEKVLGNLYSLK